MLSEDYYVVLLIVYYVYCSFERERANIYYVQYRPARKNVCHKKLRLNLLGSIRNWA